MLFITKSMKVEKMNDLVLSEEKADTIIALLKLIAGQNIKEIKEKREHLLSVPKKNSILDACDGTKELNQIAKKIGVSYEYVRLTVAELENAGLIIFIRSGKKNLPKKVI